MWEVDSKEILDLQASSSSAMDISEENSIKVEEEDNMKPFDIAFISIFDELVDDAVWELCFEVHKSVRSDYFFLEDPEKRKHQLVEDAEKDIFGQALKSKVQTFQISCPICIKKSCATKFASHLAKCIGISGRNSSRAANKKIAAATLYCSDLDENDFDSDSSFNSNRKRSKKNQSKKNSRRKQKIQGNSFHKSSSEINANYQAMTYEERKAFFNQMCGVISKRKNKMCMNSHKCVIHTDEQRRDVRHTLLRDMGDQLTVDGQIDVDTVDEGNDQLSFIAESTSSAGSFTSDKKLPSSTKNSATQFRKKKTSLSSIHLTNSPSQVMSTGNSFDSIQ